MTLRERQAYINTLDEIISEVEVMQNYYPQHLKKELERIGRTVISEWYDSYSNRKLYDPYGSLYHAYKIEVDNSHYLVTFDNKKLDNISHHQSNEIIYNNSFIEGYHGGSMGDGLSSNIPHWRTPHPFYSSWGKPAIKSFSPYEKMYDLMEEEINSVKAEMKRKENGMIQRLRRFM